MHDISLPWQNLNLLFSRDPHKSRLEILPRRPRWRIGQVWWCGEPVSVLVQRSFCSQVLPPTPLLWCSHVLRVGPLDSEIMVNRGEDLVLFKTSLSPFYLILNNSLVQFRAGLWQSGLSKSGSKDSEVLGDGERRGQSLAHPGCMFKDTDASLAGATAGSKWVTSEPVLWCIFLMIMWVSERWLNLMHSGGHF